MRPISSRVSNTVGIYIRGAAMGAADLVPGVSGGTIAFITGIYGRLIASLKSFDLQCLGLLLKMDFVSAWKKVDAAFLLTLIAGVLTSIFSLAHGIDYLLGQYPIYIGSVFFGLIAASAATLSFKNLKAQTLPLFFLALGIGLMLLLSGNSYIQLSPALPFVFLAGLITISAMLLPGVSGSFLLLLFGLYEPTLEAVKVFDLTYLCSFAMGAVTGLLLFSRLIHWLLENHYLNTLMLLIGLLFGSLYALWPWFLMQGSLKTPVLPGTLENYGQDAMLYPALGCMISGVAFVFLLEYITGRFSREDNQHQ